MADLPDTFPGFASADEFHAALDEAYELCKGNNWFADKHGHDHNFWARFFARRGIVSPSEMRRFKISERNGTIAARLSAGESGSSIAADLGVSRMTVTRVASALGLARPRRTRPEEDAFQDAVLSEHALGESLNSIAARHGESVRNVRYALNKPARSAAANPYTDEKGVS